MRQYYNDTLNDEVVIIFQVDVSHNLIWQCVIETQNNSDRSLYLSRNKKFRGKRLLALLKLLKNFKAEVTRIVYFVTSLLYFSFL